jgi:hypothetical protein
MLWEAAMAKAKAAIAMLRTVSAKKNTNRSCSPATSPNLLRYHPARSCRCSLIGACTSAQRAASTGSRPRSGSKAGSGLDKSTVVPKSSLDRLPRRHTGRYQSLLIGETS